MKKILCLMISMLSLGLVMGQEDGDPNDLNVVGGVLQHSPHSFMVLPSNPNNPTANDWVRCWYVTNTPSYSYQDANWQSGINNPNSNMATHRVYTANSDADLTTRDCYSCYLQDGAYKKNFKFPLLWNSDTVTGGNIRYEHQYMQLFYAKYSGSGNNAQGQKIEYKFKVTDSLPVLLLHFTYIMQSPGHSWEENPYVDIRLLNENGQLLNIGYYPNDYRTNGNLHAGNPAYNNTNWPYSRFFVEAPAGSDSPQTPPQTQTPSTLDGPYGTVSLQTCPSNAIRTVDPSDPNYPTSSWDPTYYDVKSYPYTIVAFNLKPYVGQTVVLRLVAMGCGMSEHFAYCRYTAKMVPGELKVKYCGGDELQLSIPWGFASYQWYNGVDSATTTDDESFLFDPRSYDPEDLSSPVLEGSTIYKPLLKPNPRKPFYRCKTVSATGVPFTYEATVNYYLLKPAFQATPRAISDSVRKCDYSVVLHNQSLIGIIRPDSIIPGKLDTLWQDLRGNPEQCTWDFGDGTPVVHGFQPEHTYADTGTYIIKLHIQDYERICTSYDTTDTVRIMIDYKMVTDTLKDTVVTCESKLPYYYKPIRFGYDNVTTKWDKNAEGERLVNFTLGLPDTLKAVDGRDSIVHVRSWNGCDSIARVKFQILTPWVNIQQDGDFCDSAKVTLLSNVGNVDEESVGYKWSFMGVHNEEDTLSDFMAISDGVYVVNIIDKSTECEASATYKIDPCVPNVFLPNCITPTSTQFDGPVQNDYFYLDQFVLRFITDIKFMVYSRNGEQLFYYEGTKDLDGNFMPPTPFAKPDEMLDRLVLWDGKVKGEVIRGTYVYTLWIVSGGQTYMYKGKLTVM
jgi:hypothetical protein